MIIKLVLITIVVTIAVTMESIVGFGTSTISLPILSLFFPIHQTLLFVGIIQFISSIWKLYVFRTGMNWRLIFTFGIPAAIASFIGASVTFQIPKIYVYKLLGIILITYSSIIFINSKIKPPKNNFFLVSGGATSGFLSGIIGLGGAIRATFLHAADLQKLTFIFTATFISFFIDLVRLTTYIIHGVRLNQIFLLAIIFYIPISVISVKVAKKVIDYLPQEKFRKLVTIFLAAFGSYLLVR